MAVCYNKLWKLLIDRGLNKTQLCKEANITTNAMAPSDGMRMFVSMFS